MSYDIHSLFAWSTVKTVVSQNATTLVITVQTGDGALFSNPQQATIGPSTGLFSKSTAMVGRITGISGDQITIDITAGNREGSNQRTVQPGDVFINGVTPKWFTDIETQVTSNTTSIASINGALPVGAVIGTTDTQTLSNKRVKKRTVPVTQSATPTINTDNTDVAYITGLAQAITNMSTNLTGTPNANDVLIISITDNGTGRAISWGSLFESSGNVTLPATTTSGVRLDVGFLWNVLTSKWRCVAVA